MAEPGASAASYIEELINANQEQHDAQLNPTSELHSGRAEYALISDHSVTKERDFVLHNETQMLDAVSPTNKPLQDPEVKGKIKTQRVTARFRTEDSSDHDYCGLMASVRVTDHDWNRIAQGEATSRAEFLGQLVDRMMSQLEMDAKSKLALLTVSPKSGLIASLVSGDIKLGDGVNYGNASAFVNNQTTASIQLDPIYSISNFPNGRRLEIRTSTNVSPIYVEVIKQSTPDNSIKVRVTDDSPASDFGTSASTYGGGNIYLAGRYNIGAYSLWEATTAPGSADSYIGGVDRASADYSYLAPIFVDAAASAAAAVPVTSQLLRNLAEAMQPIREVDERPVIMGGYKLINDITQSIGAEYLRVENADGTRSAVTGKTSAVLYHPAFGSEGVELVASQIAPNDRLIAVSPSDWRAFYWGTEGGGGLEVVGRGNGNNGWYRVASATPGAGDSMFWQRDYRMPGFFQWCDAPYRQAVLRHVKPSAKGA